MSDYEDFVKDNLTVRIVNKKTNKQEGFYIGRGSPVGNPFSFSKSKYETTYVGDRDTSIIEYEKYILEKMKYNNSISNFINECCIELLSKNIIILICFCKPLPCHGDVLAEIILNTAIDRKFFLNGIFK